MKEFTENPISSRCCRPHGFSAAAAAAGVDGGGDYDVPNGRVSCYGPLSSRLYEYIVL